ncbi:hypothetical protein [Paenibacillus sp. NEAU-GSW1]|uniref:hypothetical protein n=1 Tax=Paenibacillus sp. NEAU-GSW1 TaxID=2682486 RepID=UPI0012E1878F|nr:hypothetical protein [Paenibacillus sp. NEAU-GSW1]MUT65492.1 hypothetical protein [Paenibacillus sp. NEAU-GSW1]
MMIAIEAKRSGAAVRTAVRLMIAALMLTALSGCMYPKSQLKQNQAAPKEAVRNVQAAIDQFQSETGILPIKNSTTETPVYEKFLIDFTQMQNKGYLSEIPSAAFEKGGNYYFIVINEETKPAVKLMNLVLFQQLTDIQNAVDEYADAHGGELPKTDEAYPGYNYIDYDALKRKTPELLSDYSGQTLAAMLDEQGKVYADYGPDLMQAVQKSGSEPGADSDLRTLLADSDLFVPVKAPVYHWKAGEPVAVAR